MNYNSNTTKYSGLDFRIVIILSILFNLSVGALPAQIHSIQKIGIEQGLSNNYVISITQDKQGFMWFATESGLNRFDGKEFRIYKKNFMQQNGISGNEFNKVFVPMR